MGFLRADFAGATSDRSQAWAEKEVSSIAARTRGLMTNRAAVDGNDDARIGCYRKKRWLASHFGGGGRVAKSCTCRKKNPDILAFGKGYAGFARRHPCGA